MKWQPVYLFVSMISNLLGESWKEKVDQSQQSLSKDLVLQICKEQFFIDIDSVHEPGSATSKLTDRPRISGNGSKNLELQRKWRHGYFGDIFGTPFWPQKWIPNVRQMLSLVTSSSLQIAGQVRQIFQFGTNILASVANSKWDKDFSLRQILPPSVFVLSLQVVDIEGQQMVYVYSIHCTVYTEARFCKHTNHNIAKSAVW